MRIASLALGIALVSGACASSGTAASDQSPTNSSTARRQNVISAQEIRESRAQTIPDMIRQLRPGWPGPGSQVTVVINNDILGGYAMLSQQPVSTASEIRYLSKSEAQSKWGMRVQETIQVITR